MEKILIIILCIIGLILLVSTCGTIYCIILLHYNNISLVKTDIDILKKNIDRINDMATAKSTKDAPTSTVDFSLYALKTDVNSLKTDFSVKLVEVLKTTGSLNSSIANLKSSQNPNNISIGTVLAYCGDINPVAMPIDFLPCDGRPCLKSQYPDLFRVIGPKFNKSNLSDPTLYFNLPDMRNMFMRGAQDDGERGTVSPWKTALPQTSKILVNSAGEHIHSLSNGGSHSHTTDTKGDHNHNVVINTAVQSGSSTQCLSLPNYNGQVTYTTSSAGAHSHVTTTNGDHNHSLGIGGAHAHTLTGGDNETSPANVKLHFIIKVT